MLRIVGRILLPLVSMLIVLTPAHAQTESPVAATAATVLSTCSKLHTSAARSLSSATKSQAQTLCKQAGTHAGAVRFWKSKERRWTLYSRYAKQACWELSAELLRGPRSLCVLGRAEVRVHAQLLSKITLKIQALLPKPHLAHNWLYDAFVCIHGGEGAWNTDTGNGYYGGLQEDGTFQRQYGPDFMKRWGTADNWPAWAQITAAIRAHNGWAQAPDPRARKARGFYPWPNTAHACGLI